MKNELIHCSGLWENQVCLELLFVAWGMEVTKTNKKNITLFIIRFKCSNVKISLKKRLQGPWQKIALFQNGHITNISSQERIYKTTGHMKRNSYSFHKYKLKSGIQNYFKLNKNHQSPNSTTWPNHLVQNFQWWKKHKHS